MSVFCYHLELRDAVLLRGWKHFHHGTPLMYQSGRTVVTRGCLVSGLHYRKGTYLPA